MNKKATVYSSSVAGVSTGELENGFDKKLVGKPAQSSRSTTQALAIILLIVGVVVFIVHFLFYRHSFPPINVDEGSFFSPAKSFAAKGMLASDIHQSFLPGAALHTYWMPPLYIVLLGSFFKLFGATVMAGKVFSLLLSCASAVLITLVARDRSTKMMAAALFLICPFIIITSAFMRVEALAILITVLAIVAVKKDWPDLALGAIAALGIMTHPLMLACAAGLGVVSLRRGIKPLLLFSLGFVVVCSPYVWYILQDVDAFKAQMTLQFLRKANASLFNLKPVYLLQSVPMVLLALFCLYKTKGENSFRLFLAVSVFLALAVVLRSNEFNYQVYLVPYTIAALLLAMEKGSVTRLFRQATPLLLYTFFVATLFSKLVKYKFRTDADFNQLVNHLNETPSWKGKAIYAVGGPDVSTNLMMQGESVERQIPVPEQLPSTWFDKYNYVIEIWENGSSGENVVEEKAQETPWRGWKASAYTTGDGAYTLTQYTK
jgi:hypothetical protein